MITILSKINHFKATFQHVHDVQKNITTVCWMLVKDPDFVAIVEKFSDHFASAKMNDIDETINFMLNAALRHDDSKFSNEEWLNFAQANEGDWLEGVEYGSDEYKERIQQFLGPALSHHYRHNPHHPEYYGEKMDWIPEIKTHHLLEMLCDWYAATKRHATGNIFKSVSINKERFGYSEEVAELFRSFYTALTK